MGRHGPILAVWITAGLAGLLLGSLLVSNRAVVVPVVFGAATLLMVTVWLVRRAGDASERRFLTRTIAAGAAARGFAVGVLLVTVTPCALVEGNFGTAYRHRAQVMPLFFIFAGKGLADWWAVRQQRFASRRQSARRARVAAFPGQHHRR